MTIQFQPKVSTYFSKNGIKKVDSEIERRRRQLEISRDVLAKNIILPAIARFQFAEHVEIGPEGIVNYRDRGFLEHLFSSGWESFRYALLPPRVLSRDLKNCNINENDYENFLKEKFNEFTKKGLIELDISKKEIDLEKIGEVYQSQPGVWKNAKTDDTLSSKIKTVETKLYRLKEDTKWYEMLRKIFSHENPVGISFGNFNIGYDPYEALYEQLHPFYQDFNGKLEKADKIKEREVEKRSKISPDLAFRLMRLHSNLMKIYSTATTNVIRSSKMIADGSSYRPRFVTLRPSYVFQEVMKSLPNVLGGITNDVSKLSRRYAFSWLKPLQKTVNSVNSRELKLRFVAEKFLGLERENYLRKKRGSQKQEIDYSEIKIVLDETIFKGLIPFTIDVRDQLESSLGYGGKSYIFV